MPNDETIRRLLKAEGKTRIYEMADGSLQERSGGSAAWRNNNPGNLKFGYAGSADPTVHTKRTEAQALASAQAHYQGVVALDPYGNAIFDSYAAGHAAKLQLLTRQHGDQTVPEMLKGYAVDDYSGHANLAAYAETIYAQGDGEGVDLRGKKIKDMSAKELEALDDGMKKQEGWKVGTTRQLDRLPAASSQAPSIDATLASAPRPPPMPAHAFDPHEGRRSPAVATLQADLALLGYTDHRGKPLSADGTFGLDTRHAVERFQHDHHLTVDGKVGPQTERALHAALHEHAQQAAVPPALDDPRNPDHALYEQALTGVRALDAHMGRATDAHSLNLAAALTVEAKREGLTRIDHVLLNDDASRTFAVQSSSPLLEMPRHASVDTMAALNTPREHSAAVAASIQPAAPVQAPAQAQAQTQASMPVQAPTLAM